MPVNKKEYMQKYLKEYWSKPGNREKQRASCRSYRARIASTPEGLAMWAKKARDYRASEGGKQKARNRFLRYHYGITLEEYERMSAEQSHACAVCRAEATAGQYSVLQVDHDHETGVVRGLLCSNCNTGIGLLQDSPQFAEQAAAYLRKHGKA